MANQLYISITDMSDILFCNVSDSHGSPTATANIAAVTCGVGVGDYIEVDMGYTTDHQVVFTGYVKSVELKLPERIYTITASSVMIRAIDYFIASVNPDAPYSKMHIKAEDLIEDLMAMAGLTDYIGDNTGFTFGINVPVKVNLTSSYDFSKFVADLLAWHLWADASGKVHFEDRKPYYVAGATTASLNTSNMTSISYSESDRDLRNRVVVYGSQGVYAEAKQASPFLPNGFYKTTVVSAPTVINTNSMAHSAATYNLHLLNRLTKRCNATALGNPAIIARANVGITAATIGVSGSWYAYSVEHAWSKDGYLTSVDGRK